MVRASRGDEMSDLFKADAGNFTREQLVELINHQTQLHIEGQAILVIAKKEIQSLKQELETTKNLLGEAVELVHILKNYSMETMTNQDCEKFLAKLSKENEQRLN